MTDVPICDGFLATRWLHSSTESDTHSFAEFLLTVELIPAFIVHPLPEKLNGRLGTILFLFRHIEVINEENGVLSKFWTPNTLTTSVHAAIDDTLGLVCRSLGREGKTQECPIFILEALVQLIDDGDRLACTS